MKVAATRRTPTAPSQRMPRWAWALLIGVLSALVAMGLRRSLMGPTFDRLENQSYDRLIRKHVEVHGYKDTSRVVIVGIDPASQDLLSHPPDKLSYPFPRAEHAKLIRELKRLGARVVGLDVLFSTPSAHGPADDDALLAAANDAGNVVWQSKYPDTKDEQLEVPIAKIRCARGSETGYANVSEDDSDQICRGIRGAYHEGSEKLTSFAMTVVERYYGHKADVHIQGNRFTGQTLVTPGLRVPLDERGDFRIRFLGPSFTIGTRKPGEKLDTKHYTSYADIVSGSLPDGFFKDKIVLVGRYDQRDPTAEDPAKEADRPLVSEDLHRTPYTEVANLADPLHNEHADPLKGQMYGIEIMAQAVINLLDRTYIYPVPLFWQFVLLALISSVVAYICTRLAPFVALIPVIALTSLFIVGGIYLFVNKSIWTELNIYWLGAALSYATVVFERHYFESKERQRTLSLFSRYVAPKVAQRLLNDPDAVRLGSGRTSNVSILFCDIRSFTARSEKLTPDEVIAWLCEHLEAMVDAIHEEDGTVDKYVGDAIMAVFGAPEAQPDHAARAVRAAIGMSEALDRVNAHREAAGLWTYQIGIGIHSGDAISGSMGHPSRPEYAVLGDTVNTSSRVESLTKEYHARVLITGETYDAAGEAAQRALYAGEINVRGRQKPVELYRVVDSPEPKPVLAPLEPDEAVIGTESGTTSAPGT